MIIQKYELFNLKLKNNFIDINLILKSKNDLYFIRQFLIYCFGYIKRRGTLSFIEKHKEGITFDEMTLCIDQKNNFVYFTEGYYDYCNKPTTLEIDELFEQEKFIELCKIGFLDYIVMTKDNYIHILIAWDKILDKLPPFVLLYQDDKDWFDVISFESQELMEKFIVDHTKNF